MKKLLLIIFLILLYLSGHSQQNNTWGYQSDIKIPVVSGSASGFQRGEGIEKSYDNNLSSIYHSPWQNTKFPITLTYNFNTTNSIDYIIYYPRADGGSNGNFKKFELYIKTKKDTDYRKIGDYDFDGDSQPSIIKLANRINSPESVKFVVKSGIGDNPENGFASCAEMEFYEKRNTNAIPKVFTDATCSALKSNVTLKEIESIKIKEYRDLASELYNKDYKSKDRVRDYFPYSKPLKVAEKNKTSPYSLLDNPTGVYIHQNEDIVLFVNDTKGQNISLRSVNFDKDYACSDYVLKEGLNKIKAKDTGLLYIMYHTEDHNAKPIKIHIASGSINGYFDIAKNTNKDWEPILNSTTCKYLDVLGKYSHLTFAVDDFKKYTPDIEKLVSVYDSIVWLESKFIGLNKYNRANKNRMYFYLSPMGYYMFATSFRTGYSKQAMYEICNPSLLRTKAIWGPAHEVGHMNQTNGFKWVGLTEVSNNVYSMYIQHAFGNQSRLATERLNSNFDGIWSNRYEKGFTEMIAGKVPHMKHADVFCKLIPFWQLELYNSQIKGYKDFYADLHEQIRLNPIPQNDGEAQLQFMKISCNIAKTDFTDFFEKWGLLAVIDENVADHSSLQNVVNYSRGFRISQKQIDELKNHVKRYKKPEQNIHYLHDECVETFVRNGKIKKGSVEKTGNKINMKGWENVVVYEIYDGDKLVFITPSSSFNLPKGIKNPIINAVPAKGQAVIEKIIIE